MSSPVYTMRALANPGPGYVTWQYGYPDFLGTYAPAPIMVGTAVIVSGPVPLNEIGKLGLEYGPVGLWLFNNNLNDSSGNGFNLSGTAAYTSDKDGHVCARLTSAWTRPSRDALLAITGAVTIECVIRVGTSGEFAVVSYGSAGDTEPTNICYLMRVFAAHNIQCLWETGAGLDRAVSAPVGSLPDGWFTHLAFTRSATNPTNATLYVDGIPVGTVNTDICTGGDSSVSRFRIGANDLGGTVATGTVFSSLKVIAAELTPAQIIDEYNRTLGGRGITYPVR